MKKSRLILEERLNMDRQELTKQVIILAFTIPVLTIIATERKK